MAMLPLLIPVAFGENNKNRRTEEPKNQRTEEPKNRIDCLFGSLVLWILEFVFVYSPHLRQWSNARNVLLRPWQAKPEAA
ncbi:MAG TPA: hypothetical protein VFB80_20435, partial [Pirellulaceae bacterium]|nr:hypothetical protein [Pirellulaceae bacterium]